MNFSLDPTTLRLFVAVCEEGTIARAAEREFIAASAISKRITDVEERIDTALLHRGQRGVVPTAAGNMLLSQARLILQRLSDLHAELGQYANGVRGQVHVVASGLAMAGVLPRDLTTFIAAHERVSLSIQERCTSDAMRCVAEGSAQIGIFVSDGTANTLESFPYSQDRLVVVADRSHPLSQRHSVAFVDTLQYAHIETPVESHLLAMMRAAASAEGRELRIRAKVPSFELGVRIASDGNGVAIIPAAALARHAHANDLGVIPLEDHWAILNLVIRVRYQATLAPAARLLVSHLRTCDSQSGFADSDVVHRE
jgi:DNA-binding transcriptional LysR family regulator